MTSATHARGVFVTGTDTGVGKTVASVALLRALVRSGRRAVGMKPVAAGIDEREGVNEDVMALSRAGNVDAPLAARNPFSFAPAIAPHLAALDAGVDPDLGTIAQAYRTLALRADAVVVEGAGGALVPLGAGTDMLDIPRELALPVVLVVGIRLGCLNHALMSTLAIRSRGLRLAGWIASRIDTSMARADDNVRWLAARLAAPLIADLRSADDGIEVDVMTFLDEPERAT